MLTDIYEYQLSPDTTQLTRTPVPMPDSPVVELPRTFALYAAFPNPFNPATTLQFDLPQSATVQLRVFDLNGRLVKTVVDGSYDAGSHGVVWDGTNANGQSVTSGMYFYRLTATGSGMPFVQTRKMLLMK